jgi:hypothetical protein
MTMQDIVDKLCGVHESLDGIVDDLALEVPEVNGFVPGLLHRFLAENKTLAECVDALRAGEEGR